MPAQPRTEMSLRMMLLLGGAGALLVAAVLAASLLMRGGGDTGPGGGPRLSVRPVSAGFVAVPQVTGLDYQAAEKRLAELGLGVAAVVRVPSARDADTVVRTYPESGGTVPQGGRVTLYVSAH